MKTRSQFESESSEIVRELQEKIKQKEQILSDYQKEHGKLEIFFSALTDMVTSFDPLPIVYKPSANETRTEVEAVIQINDVHMGASQDENEIEGFNAYDPDVAMARCFDHVHRFCRYIDRQRTGYLINNCSVLVLGDLISGDIHTELQVTNAFPVTVQVVKAAQLLAEQIHLLSQNFNYVNVHFIGADNHGRLTRKPQAKHEGLNSLNYLVGVLAESYLEKCVNVNFNIYPQHEKVVRVLNRNYLITHGHGIMAWMGVPWYSIGRKVGREAEARMQLIMDQKLQMHEIGFHKFVFAHFHTPIDSVMYSCAGSVQGTDAYDHKNGRYAPPSQAGWLVHPRYKEFARVDFEL